MSELIVVGAKCLWWDNIEKAGTIYPAGISEEHAMPCCPYCGSVLFQYEDEAEFFKNVPKYEENGHPGYGDFLKWTRGKCFRNINLAKKMYQKETGVSVP